ncbi:hypothetical protein [Arcobacter peruensis]|uniref:hypothetical protein n=1 Tax=Arcobacter peruensis TaxID=2320140 RepID=UPI000F07BD70|nr:hypothetical protein [Arcobacter peruensis]
MSKITLDIDDKNIETVLTILNNLKPGLIKNLSTTSNNINSRMQAKKLSKQQNIEEDEFMSKRPSTGKYLSKTEYKNKLQKVK